MELNINDADALELIKTRRSTRAYKKEPVEPEKLEMVLEAGRFAPSGGNSQTTHFFVVTAPKVLKELEEIVKESFSKMDVTPDTYRSLANAIKASKAGEYVFHHNAPVLILTANKKGYGNNMADCVAAVENMMVMANALDLGSCYINQLNWLNENEDVLDFLRQLGLREDERVYASIVVGYPDTEDGKPVREPLPRRGNEVTFIK